MFMREGVTVELQDGYLTVSAARGFDKKDARLFRPKTISRLKAD